MIKNNGERCEKFEIFFEDKELISLNTFIEMIRIENLSQLRKWGTQKHLLAEWMLFITEELGEMSKAVSEYMYRNGDYNQIIKEGIQVITLTLKIIESIRLYERIGFKNE